MLRNWREATGNVKRWHEKEDIIPLWMASGLLWAEAGFRMIRHAEDLPRLAAICPLSLGQSMINSHNKLDNYPDIYQGTSPVLRCASGEWKCLRRRLEWRSGGGTGGGDWARN
ncbi:MAG: hypothetical protein RLZZ179_3290 [Verrucomicrobiota bacterium]|jgi:hypothetical protein